MPIPLSSNEIIHVDHKIKEASYSMPHMQAASDHYMLGYLVSGDRKWFSYEQAMKKLPKNVRPFLTMLYNRIQEKYEA